MPIDAFMLLEIPKNEHSAIKRMSRMLLTSSALRKITKIDHVVRDHAQPLLQEAVLRRLEEPDHEKGPRRQDHDEEGLIARRRHRPAEDRARADELADRADQGDHEGEADAHPDPVHQRLQHRILAEKASALPMTMQLTTIRGTNTPSERESTGL